MRKNHHGKKDRLVKRVFALCLALAVICTCLVPVFATEGLIDPQVNQEASRPVDDGEASYPDDEFAGFGEEEATRPVDGGEAAGFGEDEVATRPVEGGEDNLDGGPTVTDSEWGTVIDYSTSTSTSTDSSSSTETQWSGEDDVVEKPDDKVVVSGDEIKKLQDMVVYRFWLRELNTLDLQDITAQAQINNMTESEYLARNGEVLWNLYFIQAVPRAETIADYSSYIENPSSNRDPKGELRQFDYWYTLDEFGNRVRLNLTDPTSNILDSKTTTVNVYAAWKDGTVGSDEEEDVDHEDLVDKNPVPVDLETKASASYEDEDGNTKSVNLPVEVKNLPSATHRLSVTHMGDNSMTEFCNTYVNELQGMQPLLGLKITPEDINSEKVQLAKGQKATVTVSGLNELPDIAEMEEMGALTADALKVLHQKDDNTVEKLDVVSYENGTLTFETSSFSPFVLALTGGYDVETLQNGENREYTIIAGETQFVSVNRIKRVDFNYDCQQSDITVTVKENSGYTISVDKSVPAGSYIVTVKYKVGQNFYTDTITLDVKRWSEDARVYFLYNPDGVVGSNDMGFWAGEVFSGTNRAKVDTTNATWVAGTNESENTIDNVVSYIVSWPDGSTGTTWTLPNEVKTSTVKHGGVPYTLQDLVFQQYQKVLKNMGLTDSGITASDLTIVLEPYKISRKNRENEPPDKHLDCNIIIRCEKAFTARFYVKDPGAQTYRPVSSKTYLNGMAVKMFEDTSIVPSDKTFDGVKYVFDGWYKETSTSEKNGEDTDSTNKVSNEEWQQNGERETTGYLPNETELTNRVVAFYAHYTPVSANLTISKTVTGLLGDTNKAFTFQILNEENQPVTLTSDNCQFGDGSGTLLDGGTAGKFTLKHGGTVIIENLAPGTYKVTEIGDGLTGYETSWKVGADGKVNEKSTVASVTMSGTNITLAFTNHCTLFPDTGVLLDTLPYIVILAVVAGGVALLMLRKHRKEDD